MKLRFIRLDKDLYGAFASKTEADVIYIHKQKDGTWIVQARKLTLGPYDTYRAAKARAEKLVEGWQ